MIDMELSSKIKIASLLCTMMVVYRHSLNYLAFFNSWTGHGISGFVEDGISLLTEIAVPYFFIISGFFFFRISYYEKKNYFKMLEKKAKTLLIPFIFWNIVGGVILCLYNRTQVGDSIVDCVQQLFMSNWYGPLWYVRDLMTLMLLVPLYGWIFLCNKSWLYLIIVLLLFYYWMPSDGNWISTESVLFFFLGGILQKYVKIVEMQMPYKMIMGCTILWVLYSFGFIPIENTYLHKINTILGLVIFWQLVNLLTAKQGEKLLTLSSYSFLIYVMHLYLIKVMKQGLGALFFENDMMALLSYILLPLITMFIIIVIGRLWVKTSLVTYNLVTGGRS